MVFSLQKKLQYSIKTLIARTHLGPFSTGLYVFIAMMCFVMALTIVGVEHMIKHNCHCRVQCCITCKEEEKEDINLDYGTYYSQEGQRRDNIMEVSCGDFAITHVWPFQNYPTQYNLRQGTRTLTMTITTIWRATCTMWSRTTTPNILGNDIRNLIMCQM